MRLAFQGLTSRSTHRVAAQLSYGSGDAADEPQAYSDRFLHMPDNGFLNELFEQAADCIMVTTTKQAMG